MIRDLFDKNLYMGRFVVRLFSFIIVYALLHVVWTFWTDLKLFPNDIIGTGYQVHLPNNYELIITEFDFCQIEDGEYNVVFDNVDSLQVIGDVVIGRDDTGFFSLETKTHNYSTYASAEQLKQAQDIENYTLLSPISFYWHHRRIYDIIANILIAVIACFCSYFAGKAVISNNDNIIEKQE